MYRLHLTQGHETCTRNVLYINNVSATNRDEKRLRVKAARGNKKPPHYEDYKISSPVMVTVALGKIIFKYMEKILTNSLQDNERLHINTLKCKGQLPEVLYDNGGTLLSQSAWNALSMRDKANYIHKIVLDYHTNGTPLTSISIEDIRTQFEENPVLLNTLNDQNDSLPKETITDLINLYAKGGCLFHKYDEGGETEKTEENNSGIIDYILRNTGGELFDSVGSVFRGLGNLAAGVFTDANQYNGTYKSGSGSLTLANKDRDLINLYRTGESQGFQELTNALPLVLNGDTLNYKLYQGNILPHKEIILRPESKTVLELMSNNTDLLLFSNAGLGVPEITDKYRVTRDGSYVLDDVGDAGMSFKKDAKGNYYLDTFDVWDMTGTVPFGSLLDENSKTNGGGPFILRLKIPVRSSRDGESDGPLLDRLSKGKWQSYINNYSK